MPRSSPAISLTTEYRAWRGMISRCENRAGRAYKHYGGRGISVCAEWRHDFAAFLAHVGQKPAPDLSLDRINNDGNYEPGNVRWADRQTQADNRRQENIGGARDGSGRKTLFPLKAGEKVKYVGVYLTPAAHAEAVKQAEALTRCKPNVKAAGVVKKVTLSNAIEYLVRVASSMPLED